MSNMYEPKQQTGLRRAEGRKADGLRYDLFPPDAMDEIAYIYTAGAKKYADRNWEDGYEWGKSIAALKRHLSLFEARVEWDQETDGHHMAQVAWHAIALLAFALRGKGIDDRSKGAHAYTLFATRRRDIPNIKNVIREAAKAAHQARATRGGPGCDD